MQNNNGFKNNACALSALYVLRDKIMILNSVIYVDQSKLLLSNIIS